MQVACQFFGFDYKVGVDNLPDVQSAKEFTRNQLDSLGIGQNMIHILWGSKRFQLPPSKLK